MLKYTATVREWMAVDPANIIAIHCKGGKGDARSLCLFHYHLLNDLSMMNTTCWCIVADNM